MTKEELLSLVNAGFTKDDIISLSATKEFQEAQPEEISKEVSEEAEESKEVSNEVAEEPTNDVLGKVNEAIDNFTKKLESFNVNNAEMLHENKGEEDLSDILARVLLPNGKEVN